MSPLPALRTFYARYVAAAAGSSDPRLIEAFSDVPREKFVGAGPWLVRAGSAYIPTPDDHPVFVYQDVLIAIDAQRNINNGQPTLHARCMSACSPRPGEVVIHIGGGTGYYTAILSKLVAPTGSVIGYELDAQLAARARENLRGYGGVVVVNASAVNARLPNADVVYVNAGVTAPVPSWLDALSTGGRLMFPLTGDDGWGWMLLVTRLPGDEFSASAICGVSFIPCMGGRDDDDSVALASRLKDPEHPIRSVRSLIRDRDPDESCWYSSNGWWLSSRSSPTHQQ